MNPEKNFAKNSAKNPEKRGITDASYANYALKKASMERLEQLQYYRKQLQQNLEYAPNGYISIHRAETKHPQFYQITKVHGHRTDRYIPSSETTLIQALMQKRYDETMLELIEHDITVLEDFLQSYNGPDLRTCYDALPDICRQYVRPIVTPDDTFIAQWRAKHPGFQNDFPNDNTYVTALGEHVRSKSELLIANTLHRLGIPYIFEPALELVDVHNNIHRVTPDFLILDLNTRTTIVYEHFGLMSDPKYAESAIEKIALYEANGFKTGETLLYSFESARTTLNTWGLEEKLKIYAKRA